MTGFSMEAGFGASPSVYRPEEVTFASLKAKFDALRSRAAAVQREFDKQIAAACNTQTPNAQRQSRLLLVQSDLNLLSHIISCESLVWPLIDLGAEHPEEGLIKMAVGFLRVLPESVVPAFFINASRQIELMSTLVLRCELELGLRSLPKTDDFQVVARPASP